MVNLALALKEIGPNPGHWHLFVDSDNTMIHEGCTMIGNLPYCHLHKPGNRYLSSLMASRIALIFGGYNSITDVLCLGLSALAIERQMTDNEQHDHLERLAEHTGDGIRILPEDCSAKEIAGALSQLLRHPAKGSNIALDGAETAARHLYSLIR